MPRRGADYDTYTDESFGYSDDESYAYSDDYSDDESSLSDRFDAVRR
jgi:hypothetical protein